MPSPMTVQEVFDNWSAYLRDVDREDFKAQLALLAHSEKTLNMAVEHYEATVDRPAAPQVPAKATSGSDAEVVNGNRPVTGAEAHCDERHLAAPAAAAPNPNDGEFGLPVEHRQFDKQEKEPIFLDVNEHYELCRFPGTGEWSLRNKLPDGDRAHFRYLGKLETAMVEAALSHFSARGDIERDAARYRFVRDPKYYAGDGDGPISKMWDAIITAGGTPEGMDAAIDAAMRHVDKQSYVKVPE